MFNICDGFFFFWSNVVDYAKQFHAQMQYCQGNKRFYVGAGSFSDLLWLILLLCSWRGRQFANIIN